MEILNQKSWSLKIVTLVVAGGLLILGGKGLYNWVKEPLNIPAGVIGLALCVWGAALLRMRAWAGKLAAGILVLGAIIAPVIKFGFGNLNRWADGENPLTFEGLLIFWALIAGSCFAAYILNKHRDRFKRRGL
jgi:hypothetical protein